MSTQPLVIGARIDAQNPWPGLSAFDEAAQRFFHGREDESTELLRLVGQAPLTVLFSKSGLGKTSLLQAGLFPRLRQQNILPVYVRLEVRDRSAPLLEQAAGALQAEISKHSVDATATNASESLWEHLHGRDVQWWSPKNQPLIPLFVFDQFEEVFTLGAENTDAIERLRLDLADLIENRIPLDLAQRIETSDLAEQLDLRGQRYKVLLSFREDFLPEVEGWKSELPSLMRNRLRLLPMNADRAVQVVSGDTLTGRTHELVNDDTAREIVRFVAAAQMGDEKSARGQSSRKAADPPWEKLEIEPALLSLVCAGLNEKRKTRAQATIDAALLKETGHTIIDDFYQRCVADVPDQARRFIEDALITEGGFRNSYPLQDALEQGLLTEPLLRQLVDRRLLRIDHQFGAERVELIHDRLTGVVREHRDHERERQRARQQWKRTLLLGSIFVGLVLVVVTLAHLLSQTKAALQAARDQARVAVAGEWLIKDPTKAALALLEVAHPDDTSGAVAMMSKALQQGLSSRVWRADGTGKPVVLKGHEETVHSAAFSPDGTRIVTASSDRTAQVWRADGTGKPVVLKGHAAYVYSAAFSPDGTRIVTASWDGTARVWRANGTGEPVVLKDHEGPVWGAAFSPDGTRVVTVSNISNARDTVRVLQADGTGEPVVLKGHEDRVSSAAFSPDGTRIVTASWDQTAQVWRADGTGEPIVLKGHEGAVKSAAFSPDGTRIVTASDDHTARVWRADGTGEPIVLKGHEGAVKSAAFSPDGTRIVTASSDQTARVWRADGTGEPIVLKGHEGAVKSAAFSPDGTRIVTASTDGTARVWQTGGTGEPVVLNSDEVRVLKISLTLHSRQDIQDVTVDTASYDKIARVWQANGTGEPIVLKGPEPLVSAAFSPDGSRVVTASWDKIARVWQANGTGEPIVLKGHEGPVKSAAFSPDGSRVVTASSDQTARVWQANGTGEPLVLKGHEAGVLSAAFSPDGSRIVTASSDQTARVWRADGTGEPLVLKGHEAGVLSAAFSPDGSRIVTASDDRTAQVWRADGIGEPIVLKGHEGTVYSAVFSPDGTRIVTASSDQTARVWRADGTGEPIVLKGHTWRLHSAVFSPDGTRIVTASSDQTARVWRADGTGEPIVLKGDENYVYSAAFSPDGTRIVTASSDTARVWRADGTGEPLILKSESDVRSTAFSPDGTRVVAASWDNIARVWAISAERLQTAIRSATRVCLDPPFRTRYFGDSPEEALHRYQTCEQAHGRSGSNAR